MTTNEIIAALAAELTRIGKMPEWYKGGQLWDFSERDCAGQFYAIENDDAALAALSGVAAEAAAAEGYYIVKSGKSFTECDEDGNEIWDEWIWEVICHDWQCGNTPISQHATYHEAMIAALKQVEVTG